MSWNFNAGTGNQYLSSTNSVPSGNTPLTFSCFVRPLNDPSEFNVRAWVSLCIPGSVSIIAYRYGSSSRAFYNGHESSVGGSLVQNSWAHVAAVFTSTTSRLAYINSSAGTENTTNIAHITPTETRIGAYHQSISGYAYDEIAEVGIWSTNLSADEIKSLYRGFTPPRVRPQSLVLYAPLIRDLTERREGRTWTNNNSATVGGAHCWRYG